MSSLSVSFKSAVTRLAATSLTAAALTLGVVGVVEQTFTTNGDQIVDNSTALVATTSPYLRVRVRSLSLLDPTKQYKGIASGVRIRTDAVVKRWRIEFSRPVRWVNHGKTTVVSGYGTPPYQSKVVWLNEGDMYLHTVVITKSGKRLVRNKTVTVGNIGITTSNVDGSSGDVTTDPAPPTGDGSYTSPRM